MNGKATSMSKVKRPLSALSRDSTRGTSSAAAERSTIASQRATRPALQAARSIGSEGRTGRNARSGIPDPAQCQHQSSWYSDGRRIFDPSAHPPVSFGSKRMDTSTSRPARGKPAIQQIQPWEKTGSDHDVGAARGPKRFPQRMHTLHRRRQSFEIRAKEPFKGRVHVPCRFPCSPRSRRVHRTRSGA